MSAFQSNAVLRTEAIPTPYRRLVQTQKLALERICLMLKSALDDLDRSGPRTNRRRPAWLDDQRRTRLAFIDGGRGTGKTTLMLTLLRRLTDGPEEGTGGTDPANQLDTGRIVLLEPLEMEPVVSSMHLFAAILARIVRAVRDDRPRPARRRLLDDNPEVLQGQARIRQFQSRVAQVLGGNLDSRAEHLDGDAYAEEVVELERNRLQLNADFQQLLEDLFPPESEGSADSNLSRPLFILPVDDVDLNVEQCLELLQLLRTASSPQLFLLVLGDSALTDLVVRMQTLEAFNLPPSPMALFGRDQRDVVVAKITQLAAAKTRKLIPPAQRVVLRPITVEEALGFTPLPSGESFK